jgi:lysophospholipase L1-like esterase
MAAGTTAATRTTTSTATFDRRGLQPFLILCLVMVVVSLIITIAYSWKIGVPTALFYCVCFITLEAISARPDNNPVAFLKWRQRQDAANSKRRPILLCLGDSLMHGNVSASITPEIPLKVTQKIGLPPAEYGRTFADPLWVVNAGQNFITSYTVRHERLQFALQVYPDYIVILIGTNDVTAMYGEPFRTFLTHINHLPAPPTMELYERHLTEILQIIHETSPMTKIGLCTLPPLGEDLRSRSNDLIRQANNVIAKVAAAAADKTGTTTVTVIPVFDEMEAYLEKNRRSLRLPFPFSCFAALWMNPLFHLVTFGGSWNLYARIIGLQLLNDGIHLTERGRDIVADAIVEWLLAQNVTKAIAVKGY